MKSRVSDHPAKEIDVWIYMAYDNDGFPVAEDYHKEKLIEKLVDEFGDYRQFTIKRVFQSWLK